MKKYKTSARRRASHLKWRLANPDKVKSAYDNWSKANPEKLRDSRRRWRVKNAEKLRMQRRERYLANREKSREQYRAWAHRNRASLNKSKREWRLKNYVDYRRQQNQWCRDKRQMDPAFRLKESLRRRLNFLVSGQRKHAGALELLGCSVADFKIYLESKFEPGMSWQNYGDVWEIDHIMPCAIFDLTRPEHQRRCFHFSNLQPLGTFKNNSKGAKVLSDQFQLL